MEVRRFFAAPMLGAWVLLVAAVGGPVSAQPLRQPPQQPCVHGKVIEGRCVCDRGWGGKSCEVRANRPLRPQIKCVHGRVVDGRCVCDPGWAGRSCEHRAERPGPQKACIHGHVVDGRCVCEPGWAGRACEVPDDKPRAGFR